MREAIEQNPKVLLARYPADYPFSYDMDAPGFMNYFRARTGYQIGREDAEPYINSDGRLIKPFGVAEVKKYQAVNRVWEINRAKIQDCWEIWIQPEYEKIRREYIDQRTIKKNSVQRDSIGNPRQARNVKGIGNAACRDFSGNNAGILDQP